jgi:uncharacterized membrane protein
MTRKQLLIETILAAMSVLVIAAIIDLLPWPYWSKYLLGFPFYLGIGWVLGGRWYLRQRTKEIEDARN